MCEDGEYMDLFGGARVQCLTKKKTKHTSIFYEHFDLNNKSLRNPMIAFRVYSSGCSTFSVWNRRKGNNQNVHMFRQISHFQTFSTVHPDIHILYLCINCIHRKTSNSIHHFTFTESTTRNVKSSLYWSMHE